VSASCNRRPDEVLETQQYFPTRHGLYCLTACFAGSSLLSMVVLASIDALQIRCYCLYCFASLASCFTCSSLLGMICIVSLHVHMFIITGNDLYCFTSCFTGSFLLGIVCIISHPSLVHSYWAWLALVHFLLHMLFLHLFYFMLPRFIISRHGFYLLTSCLTGSSLLGMACIASLHASHVHHYSN
jgi:hypothetical protein